MIKKLNLTFTLILCIFVTNSISHSTQRPYKNTVDEEPNTLLDFASSFLQETIANGQGGDAGSAIGGIASLIGTFMQANGGGSGGSGQSRDDSGIGGIGAAQILSGIGSLLASNSNNDGRSNGQGFGGFDPSIIGNVIQLFAAGAGGGGGSGGNSRKSRSIDNDNDNSGGGGGIGLDTILNVVSAFTRNNQNNDIDGNENESQDSTASGLISLLPMAMQMMNSFAGAEGGKIQEKHADHAWILPPFLEKLHIMWDHFSQSELADALWKKSGIHSVFMGFTGRDGKLNYDRLLESLNNQSFRRRWIKAAITYLSDWANYIANPEVYARYFGTAQVMWNGFLQSQNVPQKALFNPQRPSETIANLVDHLVRHHLNTKISSITYVKPAVGYAKDIIELGKARGLLQNFNVTELSDKLTDTVNLEIIEPVLKVHRAYRFAIKSPQCDKYVLCELNTLSHQKQLQQQQHIGVTGLKSGITKFGSMAAAWFITAETGTPFWTLFSVINESSDCKAAYPVDCTDFDEGEASVTTEYIHNEL